MDFKAAVETCFRKYAIFTGRAARPEFWWFILFGFLGNLIAGTLDRTLFGGAIRPMGGFGMHGLYGLYGLHGPQLFGSIFGLAMLLPTLAVGARRLHDIGRSGWWQLLVLIPVVGALVLLYWYVQPGTRTTNQFGAPTAA